MKFFFDFKTLRLIVRVVPVDPELIARFSTPIPSPLPMSAPSYPAYDCDWVFTPHGWVSSSYPLYPYPHFY